MESALLTHKWLVRNHDKMKPYQGKWVAVAPNGVFASAGSLDALMNKLTEEQKASFLVTRIPTLKEAANVVL